MTRRRDFLQGSLAGAAAALPRSGSIEHCHRRLPKLQVGPTSRLRLPFPTPVCRRRGALKASRQPNTGASSSTST